MRLITTSLFVTTAFLGLCVSEAHAQAFVVARVPFAFTLRGQQFPAGTYEVRENTTSSGLLTIRGTYNGKVSFAFEQPAIGVDPAGDKPAFVFNHFENGYELAQVWQSGTEGMMLPSDRRASDTARADTGTNGSGESTYVIAEARK